MAKLLKNNKYNKSQGQSINFSKIQVLMVYRA